MTPYGFLVLRNVYVGLSVAGRVRVVSGSPSAADRNFLKQHRAEIAGLLKAKHRAYLIMVPGRLSNVIRLFPTTVGMDAALAVCRREFGPVLVDPVVVHPCKAVRVDRLRRGAIAV